MTRVQRAWFNFVVVIALAAATVGLKPGFVAVDADSSDTPAVVEVVDGP